MIFFMDERAAEASFDPSRRGRTNMKSFTRTVALTRFRARRLHDFSVVVQDASHLDSSPVDPLPVVTMTAE
jgi:hypothetical protein